MVLRFFRKSEPLPEPRLPAGMRAYAIGDVHGCLAQLDQLLAMIEADDTARGAAETHLILLGDLVDRGPQSAAVVERAVELARTRPNTRFIAGNHEEMFLAVLDGDVEVLRGFERVGGDATILSYGVDPDAYRRATFEELVELVQAAVPDEHVAFMRAMEDWVVLGDYLFVHAGIRPGIPLEEQRRSDLRWIRNSFLNHAGSHGRFVIHGHTITDDVDVRPNRIGIDTGAFASGRLTAIGLEGKERWFLQTEASPAAP